MTSGRKKEVKGSLLMKLILRNSITWLIAIDLLSTYYFVYGINNTVVELPMHAYNHKIYIGHTDFISSIDFWDILETILINILWMIIAIVVNHIKKSKVIGYKNIKKILTIIYCFLSNAILLLYALYIYRSDWHVLSTDYSPNGLLCKLIIYIVPNAILNIDTFPIVLYLLCWGIINLLISYSLKRY